MNLLHISLPSRYPATPARSDRRRQSRRQRPELLGLEQRNLLSIAVAHGIEAVPLDRGAIVVVGGHDHASGVTDDRGSDDNGNSSSGSREPEPGRGGDDSGSGHKEPGRGRGGDDSGSGHKEPGRGRGGDDSGSGHKHQESHSGKSPAHSNEHHKPQKHHDTVKRPIVVHV